MASENPKTERTPARPRLPNPLNVVVEKVGATRAMVHGDVSVESLKELLMSSMSLLPTTSLENDNDGLKKSVSSHRDEEEGSGTGLVAMTDKMKGQKSAEDPTKKKIDTQNEKRLADSSGKIEDKTMSKEILEDRKKLLETNAGRKSKSRGVADSEGEEEVEGNEEEEEDARESLPSCASTFDVEKLPFSNNGRWLQMHFGKALVLGLKDVVKKKPQDPVSYFGFWLREFRSKQEAEQRRIELDDELRRKRSSIAKRASGPKEPVKDLESEFDDDGEEGGENSDWNFRNYYPGSEVSGATPEVAV